MLETVELMNARCAKTLGLTEKQHEKLAHPHGLHIVKKGKPYIGVRVQHRLPAKGGMRIAAMPESRTRALHQAESEATALASWMTAKCCIAGLPFGGGKGELLVPANDLDSFEDRQRHFIDFVSELIEKGAIGPHIDVPAPDMNTGAEEMDPAAELYAEITKDPAATASFTGKSIKNGGSEGREEATGLGLAIAIDEYTKQKGIDPRGMTVAIQGAGNVGSNFYEHAEHEIGVRIVGISDKDVAVVAHDKSRPLLATTDETKSSVQFANRGIASYDEMRAKELSSPNDLLKMDVDMMVLAGPSDVDIWDMKAGMIYEGANGALDYKAIDYLQGEKRHIGPGALFNLGGVTASCFEHQQNLSGERWSQAEVRQKLDKTMRRAVREVVKLEREHGIPSYEAAHLAGMIEQIRRDENNLWGKLHEDAGLLSYR